MIELKFGQFSGWSTREIFGCCSSFLFKSRHELFKRGIRAAKSLLAFSSAIESGSDITLVTYGSCCRIALAASKELKAFNISLEVIDIQSLIPFDINHDILKSIKKTNRVIFMDEDVPGGATAYMLQKVLEEQNGYHYLDSKPLTITAKDHRPAYGDDGDYFSKSNMDDVIDACYQLMHESKPDQYPKIF